MPDYLDLKERKEVWGEDFEENKEIADWLNSEDFLVQIIDQDFGLIEKGRLIISTAAH